MSEKTTSGGLGLAGVLTIIFVVLKLTNNINWPWLWVLSPLWISVGLSLIVMVIFLISFLVISKRD